MVMSLSSLVLTTSDPNRPTTFQAGGPQLHARALTRPIRTANPRCPAADSESSLANSLAAQAQSWSVTQESRGEPWPEHARRHADAPQATRKNESRPGQSSCADWLFKQSPLVVGTSCLAPFWTPPD